MDKIADNFQKHENYKEQNERLTRALKHHFYLEAIFIEYSILEDRTESILRYTGDMPKPNSNGYVSIDKKIGKIEKLTENKKSIIRHYFPKELTDELSKWKESRNAMIHALIKRVVTTEELEAIALEGEKLAKKMCHLSTNYKRKLQHTSCPAMNQNTIKEVQT